MTNEKRITAARRQSAKATKEKHKKLIAKSKRYAKQANISLATLSTRVVNDGSFFKRIADGGSCTVPKYEFFMAYLDEAEAELRAGQ